MALATEVQTGSRVEAGRTPAVASRAWTGRARCLPVLCLVLGCQATAGSSAGETDVVATLNSVRASDCARGGPAGSPLRVERTLTEVARNLAAGNSLSAAAITAGYRAEKVTSIYLRDPGKDALGELIVRRFCDTVMDPELTEAGAYRQAEQTWIVLARPRPPQGVVDPAGVIDGVVQLINEARRHARSCGAVTAPAAEPLRGSADLQRAAQVHANDLAARGTLSHQGADGSRPADRVGRAGYDWSAVAENVAAGPSTAEAAVAIWLASPGHCENLMSERYAETGVAYAVSADGERVYWVQVFAAPR